MGRTKKNFNQRSQEVDTTMKGEIRLICEGDLQCPNPVFLTKDAVKELRLKQKNILCDSCKQKYS